MNDNTAALPPLPEWSRRDDLGGLVPSDVRQELVKYARAALAQRQQVPAITDDQCNDAIKQAGLWTLAMAEPRNLALLRGLCRAALTAAPSAQAEPMTPYTLAKSAGVKGSQIMQALARVGYQVTLNQELGLDQIASALAAQAEPQEPLTDEQIVMDGLMMTPTKTLESCADAFTAGVRFAERAHGIGKQEVK